MQLQIAAASINNGETTIVCTGATLIGNILQGHWVQFDGEDATYCVAADCADNTSIAITAPYAGTNKTNASLNVWRDFLPTTGQAALNASDRGWVFSLAKWQRAVETVLGGWRATLQPCKWSTTTAPAGTYNSTSKQFTYTATGALSIDGGSPVVNDRVLVRHGNYQGVYYVLNAGGTGIHAVLQRAVDMFNTAVQGATVWVMAGTANALTQWYLSTAGPITIDTSTIAWTSIPFFGVPPVISGTSSTSLTIPSSLPSSQSLTVTPGMSLYPLQACIIVYDASHYMEGFITSYNGTTGALIVNVTSATGTGTYASWTVSLAGVVGDKGDVGYSGVWIVGAGAPSAGTGNNGDMYLNITTSDVYGPKSGGAWGSIVLNIKGATGYSPTWILAAGAPAAETGNNGDMYINTTTDDVYGPKAAGAWGSIVANIKGATGPAPTLAGTSSTSTTIPTPPSSKTFTTQAGMSLSAGQFLVISSNANPANYMHCQITSYSGTSLVVNVLDVGGSGTFTDWNISLSGPRGASGAGTFSGPGSSTQHNLMGFADASGSVGEDSGIPASSVLAQIPTIQSSATYSAAVACGTVGGKVIFKLTAQNAGWTQGAPTGTPQDGQMILHIFRDNGTPRAITWTGTAGGYASTTITLPSTTVASTELRVLTQYSSTANLHFCIGVA